MELNAFNSTRNAGRIPILTVYKSETLFQRALSQNKNLRLPTAGSAVPVSGPLKAKFSLIMRKLYDCRKHNSLAHRAVSFLDSGPSMSSEQKKDAGTSTRFRQNKYRITVRKPYFSTLKGQSRTKPPAVLPRTGSLRPEDDDNKRTLSVSPKPASAAVTKPEVLSHG